MTCSTCHKGRQCPTPQACEVPTDNKPGMSWLSFFCWAAVALIFSACAGFIAGAIQ